MSAHHADGLLRCCSACFCVVLHLADVADVAVAWSSLYQCTNSRAQWRTAARSAKPAAGNSGRYSVVRNRLSTKAVSSLTRGREYEGVKSPRPNLNQAASTNPGAIQCEEVSKLELYIAPVERELREVVRQSPACQLLLSIPGVGLSPLWARTSPSFATGDSLPPGWA